MKFLIKASQGVTFLPEPDWVVTHRVHSGTGVVRTLLPIPRQVGLRWDRGVTPIPGSIPQVAVTSFLGLSHK
jgi:hypothetical protein